MFKHYYSRYGLALTMLNNNLQLPKQVNSQMLANELEQGQNHFRLEPLPLAMQSGKVKFQPLNKIFLKNHSEFIGKQGKIKKDLNHTTVAEISYFLAPTIITSNKGAKNVWDSIDNIIESLKNKGFYDNCEAKMSVLPVSGKINNGKISQSNPRSSLFEIACAAITTVTPYKPAMLVGNAEPSCILPDLELEDLMKFIALFKRMLSAQTSDLMLGKVVEKRQGNALSLSFQRPKICNGNFPFAPRQSILGSAGLLGAIGRWSKQAGYSKEGLKVLDSLKNRPMYIVKYGDATSVTYGEWVVELAKEDKLSDIIDALERSDILSEETRSYDSSKFQTFLLFASRFLQLFDEKSMQDFLATRAEYAMEVEKLFNTFFEKVMGKPTSLIQSACALGRWLNKVAYFAAKEEAESRQTVKAEDIRKLKAKFLAEMESTALSAKTHDALIAQVITRAGRLSYMDAPPESLEFINAVTSESIPLAEAKNLIIAYSRIQSVKAKDRAAEEELASETDSEELNQENDIEDETE
ncbi:MAG: hypothetical protein RML35_00665 [Chloroherpetonaceae bacterium]|nr:hypothetical protein [Chloroherpetonaceae bacterium]